MNTLDAFDGFHGKDGGIGMGLGTLIMLVNVLIGGRLKHFSKHPVRYRAWTVVSRLNTRHMQLAWTTLGTLMVTDAYIALVASGVVTDLRFFN